MLEKKVHLALVSYIRPKLGINFDKPNSRLLTFQAQNRFGSLKAHACLLFEELELGLGSNTLHCLFYLIIMP